MEVGTEFVFILVCPAAVPKYHELVAYTQQECISHGSGGGEVQKQSTSRFGIWLGPVPSSFI
jgi:hypothetical protein